MKNITVLDCTLRDGAYITNSYFGEASIRGIINKMEEAGIDIIECGWLKDSVHQSGSTFFHIPADIVPYLTTKDHNKTYVAMIDWNRYDIDNLPQNNHESIDAIRVVFPHGNYKEGIAIGNKILHKGYKVYFQAANTLEYSDEDLIALANEVNLVDAEALSIVDTFGAMYPEDLDRIVTVLDEHLNRKVKLGFHSHNNQQLSFALSMEFAQLVEKTKRQGIIDSSLCGMGRGAGNATTELITSFLNKKYDAHYDLDSIMDAIDTYMEPYKAQYQWGYSTPNFIAGLYCCHVNNIAYLLDNHRTNAKQMRNIIETLSPEDRIKYDYNLLEEKYIKNKNYYIDDTLDFNQLRAELKRRKVLLVAPGKLALDKQNHIKEVISQENPVVIGVNAILPEYDYDYLFFVNPARYEFAMMSYSEVFETTKHILLTTVKNTPSKNEYIICFDKAIKKGWKYFDNAVICALRLLEKLEPETVFIAGFDGFKSKYNESYADASLPSLNPDTDWNIINQEIFEMFSEYKMNSTLGDNIVFVTESIFEGEQL